MEAAEAVEAAVEGAGGSLLGLGEEGRSRSIRKYFRKRKKLPTSGVASLADSISSQDMVSAASLPPSLASAG